jgi:hypothetical protein
MTSPSHPIDAAIANIIAKFEQFEGDWSNSAGWAPQDAAELLGRSRLDRLVSLAHCLSIWSGSAPIEDAEGRLILAWANLGALVEGTMKLFLSVHYRDYCSLPKTRGQAKIPIEPDALELEQIRQFFREKVWDPIQQSRWNPFVELVQKRRNAIHAYKDRDIGKIQDFRDAVVAFVEFLTDIACYLPDPPPGDGY